MNKKEISEQYGISQTFIKYSIRYLESLQRKVFRIQGSSYNKGLLIQNVECSGGENQYSTFIMHYKQESHLNHIKAKNSSPTNISKGSDDVYKYFIVDFPYFKHSLSQLMFSSRFKFYKKIDFLIIFSKITQLYELNENKQIDHKFYIDTIFEGSDGQYFCQKYNEERNSFLDINIKSEQYLKFLEQNNSSVNYIRSNVGVYKLGLIFLQILGLKLNQEIYDQIQLNQYYILQSLQQQDLVKFIQENMLCQEIKRINLNDLKYLLRFAYIHRQDMLQSEKLEFIQKEIDLDIKGFINNQQNSNYLSKLEKEVNKEFGNYNSLFYWNKLGIVVKSLKGRSIEFLMVGKKGGLYEDYIIEFVLNLNEDYPYKPPKVKVISDISYHPLINEDKVLSLDILQYSQFKPCDPIRQILHSVAEVFNINPFLNLGLFSEDADIEFILEMSDIDKTLLQKFDELFATQQLIFLNIYSDLLFEQHIVLQQILQYQLQK